MTFCLLLSACGHHLDAYDNLLKDEGAALGQIASIGVPGESDAGPRGGMRVPLMEAQFCLERAKDDIVRAGHSTAADVTLTIVGEAGLAGGAAAQAGAAAMEGSGDAKRRLQVGGAISLAAAAGILGLRTALSFNDVARSERIAAARNVDAAIGILVRYALANDPSEVTDDEFATCRDGDIAIANSYRGGERTTEESEKKQSEKAADAAKAADKAQDEYAKAAADARKKQEDLANAAMEADRKLSDAVQAVAASLAGVAAATDTTNARVKLAEAQEGLRKLAADRTGEEDRTGVAAQVEEAGKAATAALGPKSSKTEPVTEKVEEAANAAKAVADKQADVKEAQDAAKAAEKEDILKRAEADYAQSQAEVLSATARFRRAVLFLTTADIQATGAVARSAFERLEASKARLEALRPKEEKK
jgi:hypothetical protein